MNKNIHFLLNPLIIDKQLLVCRGMIVFEKFLCGEYVKVHFGKMVSLLLICNWFKRIYKLCNFLNLRF